MPLSRLPRLSAVAAAAALLLGACSASTSHDDAPGLLDGWQQVALPDSMVPASLRLTDGTLLVGGSTPTGSERAPALAALATASPDARPVRVPLTPATPYGKVADLTALTAAGDEVVALGAAHGGAHANFRWTIWTGSTSSLVDQPQTFETFGGWEAGTLLGLATDRRGPLVVGTWQGEHGADGAIWRPDGKRWLRQPRNPALVNTSEHQVAPRTVSQQADGAVVVNGSVIDLSDGVRQSAALWRDVDGSWTSIALGDPGRRSEAWSTACGPTCWTAGDRDGVLAVWSGGQRTEVPTIAVGDTDTARVALGQDRVVIVASSQGAGRMVVGAGDQWRTYTTPDGIPTDVTLVGTRLYLVTGTGDDRTLWLRDLSDVLTR